MAAKKADAAEGGDETEAVKPAGSGANKLILILVILNILGMAGLATYLIVFKGGESTAAAQGEEEGEEGDAEAEGEGEEELDDDPYVFGPLIQLDPLIVNLSGGHGGRYVRVTIHLEARQAERVPEIEAAVIPIRNRLIIYFSGKTSEDLRVEGAKEAIQEELPRVVNDVLGAAMVKRVFYSEFVIQ